MDAVAEKAIIIDKSFALLAESLAASVENVAITTVNRTTHIEIPMIYIGFILPYGAKAFRENAAKHFSFQQSMWLTNVCS